MSRERVLTAESRGPEEEQSNVALRPRKLEECIGQREVIEQLKIALAAAKKRGEPLEHILLDGPPGLGKTTFAHVIAEEMGRSDRIVVTSGPSRRQLRANSARFAGVHCGRFRWACRKCRPLLGLWNPAAAF